MVDTDDFEIGDSVIVKDNIMDPDNPTISLAGWQGRVNDLYPDDGTLEILWDSITLKSMSSENIRACELKGLGWDRMTLGTSDVQFAEPRDEPGDAVKLVDEISKYHQWDHLSDTNPGIARVLADVDGDDEFACLEAWEEYLTATLKFPFIAMVEESTMRGTIGVGDQVKVIGLDESDDSYGLLVDTRVGRERFTLPLCDLEAVDKATANYKLLRDYVVWFANR